MTTPGPPDRPAAVLVTGMSGTGTSSALVALAARGHAVLDTDELARVTDRANPFGSTPRDRERIAADLAEVEPVLRAGATHEIDTTAPLAEVVTRLERLVRSPAARPTPPPQPGRA